MVPQEGLALQVPQTQCFRGFLPPAEVLCVPELCTSGNPCVAGLQAAPCGGATATRPTARPAIRSAPALVAPSRVPTASLRPRATRRGGRPPEGSGNALRTSYSAFLRSAGSPAPKPGAKQPLTSIFMPPARGVRGPVPCGQPRRPPRGREGRPGGGAARAMASRMFGKTGDGDVLHAVFGDCPVGSRRPSRLLSVPLMSISCGGPVERQPFHTSQSSHRLATIEQSE